MPNSIYNIHNPLRVKHLTRWRIGFSHLKEHKVKHNFQDLIDPTQCSVVQIAHIRHCVDLHICVIVWRSGKSPATLKTKEMVAVTKLMRLMIIHLYIFMCVFCLFIYLFVYLFTYSFVFLFVYLIIYLFIHYFFYTIGT